MTALQKMVAHAFIVCLVMHMLIFQNSVCSSHRDSTMENVLTGKMYNAQTPVIWILLLTTCLGMKYKKSFTFCICFGGSVKTTEDINPKLLYEIKLHGFLLWTSVGFLMPVAILVKRMSNREQSAKRIQIIFYIHAITQVLAVLLATAAAVISIQHFDNAFNNDHQRIGLAFYVVMWLQAILAIFRPKTGSKGRSTWFMFHWLLGITVSLLGVISIYSGLQAYHERTSRHARVWAIIFTFQLSLLIFLYLLQEKWQNIQKQGAIEAVPSQQMSKEMSPRC